MFRMLQLEGPSFPHGALGLEMSLDTEDHLLRSVVHLRHLLRSQDDSGRVLAAPDARAVEEEYQRLVAAREERSPKH